ncbi:MAG: VCBS repeat-containing protein, partial [Pseudomonadota bacterium]
VVESQAQTGASLVVYDETGKVAATPHIGTSFRWLAPIGAADLDGDGFVELAYIDRPHLAKTLRVWRFSRGKLQPVASLAGLTNHRIGEDFITGGVRDCSGQPELITADAGWQRIVATRLERGILNSSDVAPFRGQASVNRALRCSVK